MVILAPARHANHERRVSPRHVVWGDVVSIQMTWEMVTARFMASWPVVNSHHTRHRDGRVDPAGLIQISADSPFERLDPCACTKQDGKMPALLSASLLCKKSAFGFAVGHAFGNLFLDGKETSAARPRLNRDSGGDSFPTSIANRNATNKRLRQATTAS